MADLKSNIWTTLDGGYKIPFDAFIPLRQLQSTNDAKITNDIFAELWDNLHHQGDLGLASYLSVPTLVDICIDKESLDWNFIGLCVLIENGRLLGHNPPLPKDFEHDYFHSLLRLKQYLTENLDNITDETTFRSILSLFATMHGQRGLGQLIEQLDKNLIQEYLDRY